MALASIQGVRLAGVASAVPAASYPVTDAASVFGAEDVQKISQSTGIERRHLSAGKLCTSDLCVAAARRLLSDLKWELDSVDAVIMVSQTFDFNCVPATSCTVQMRLGLSTKCAAFDVALGCSGHVYGLWIAASLLAASGMSRVLLLAGDMASRTCSPLDRATALLFGDAGTATALERDASAKEMTFSLGTDGSGWKNLIIPGGGFRNPRDEKTSVMVRAEGNNIRSAENVLMDGAEVFAFTLREVGPMVNEVLVKAGWSREDVDFFVFHQANEFMLKHLAKSMKIPIAKVPLSLREYGNTSSASIPLTISSKLREEVGAKALRLVIGGFGVGYSWAACCFHCGPIVAPEVILVEESEAWNG